MNNVTEKAYVIEPIAVKENCCEKIEEIKSLILSAGAEYYGEKIVTVREINPATFIGSGKLEEILSDVIEKDVNLIVFDGDLSPSQTINISSALNDIKVIDRTTLILDIFASNAFSDEGKTQVELAQLRYIYPRLKGKGGALSRLGGGIGTRGPGETKLETDRRHIRARITALEKKLKELQSRRSMQMQHREKNECKTVALVGYTNTGKSTLLNILTDSDVYVKDKLFATLDPTIRKLKLENLEVLLIDTVGFVKNIPHHIIEAFKSTLEFAVKADLILNVCDGNGNWKSELETTNLTLESFEKLPPIITVINKCDLIDDFTCYPADAIFISAKTGKGLNLLKNAIEEKLSNTFSVLRQFVSYEQFQKFTKMAHLCHSVNYEYLDEGVIIYASIPNIYISKIENLLNIKIPH